MKRGFIATATVLVLMVVAISIIMTVSLLGIGEAQGSLALTKGEQALFFVEGCTEQALLNVKNDAGYTGGDITLPEGTCTVTVNSGIMTVSNTSTDYKRTIRAVFTRGSTISLTSWQEI